MAYQQPTAFFSKPTELTSEDFLNGVRTQDAAETYRRKRALADAFSKSITTKPVIADEDKVDASGTIIQRKGDIIARPGDVDQQKFFEHSAKAGLGFDEAAAVYNHYDMQKKAALSALKTGIDINALGGGTGVEGRAGAPVFRNQPAQQTTQATQLVTNPEPQAPAVAPAPVDELSGLSDEKKIDKLTRWMNSKKKDLVAKAQSVLGAPVDGVSGKKTRMAMSDFKDALIKSNLRKDVTQGAQNRVDIISNTPSNGEKGKLVADDAFNTQPARMGQIEDTRTSLQVIEDRAGANNFGQSNSAGNSFEAPKLSEFGQYAGNVSSVLKKNGLSNDDAGIKKYLDFAVNAIPVFKYDTGKSASENKIIENKLNADRQAAYNKAKEGLASGVDVVKGQALATAANNRAETEFKQARTISKGLGDYGIKELAPADAAKAGEALKQFQLAKSIEESTADLIKNGSKLTPDELSNAVKQPLMMMAQIEGAGNEKQEEGLMAGLRQDKGIAAILDKNAGKNWKEQIDILATSKLTSQSQAKFLRLLNDYAKDIVRNGKARNELETYARVTGSKFDPNAGEGSGARKGLSKGLKTKETAAERHARLFGN